MTTTPHRPRQLTLIERVHAHIAALGHTEPGEKTRRDWAPAAPGPLRQLLVDVAAALEEKGA